MWALGTRLLIIPGVRVLVLTKTHVGSGNEIRMPGDAPSQYVFLVDTHQSNFPFMNIHESRYCPAEVRESMHAFMLTHFVLARGVFPRLGLSSAPYIFTFLLRPLVKHRRSLEYTPLFALIRVIMLNLPSCLVKFTLASLDQTWLWRQAS